MAAEDNLSMRLFHGTDAALRSGHVRPTKQRGDEWDGDGPEAAFASMHLEDAARYGKNVFEVHPHNYMEHYGSGVVASEDGFQVKRKIKPEVVDRYSRIYGPIREEQERRAHGKWMHENNMEQWRHEGDKHYHVTFDKDGNEQRTLLQKGQLRPGDPVKP